MSSFIALAIFTFPIGFISAIVYIFIVNFEKKSESELLSKSYKKIFVWLMFSLMFWPAAVALGGVLAPFVMIWVIMGIAGAIIPPFVAGIMDPVQDWQIKRARKDLVSRSEKGPFYGHLRN